MTFTKDNLAQIEETHKPGLPWISSIHLEKPRSLEPASKSTITKTQPSQRVIVRYT